MIAPCEFVGFEVHAEGAGAEESAILAQKVDMQKGCDAAAMMAKEVAIVATGGKSIVDL